MNFSNSKEKICSEGVVGLKKLYIITFSTDFVIHEYIYISFHCQIHFPL